MTDSYSLFDAFDACNDTEIYQIARRAGLPVLPSMPKLLLIGAILGEEELPPLSHPHEVDLWRLALMQFVIDHRAKIESQITCPAKTMDPHACFGCVDAQVVSCLVHNRPNMPQLVQIRKKLNTR